MKTIQANLPDDVAALAEEAAARAKQSLDQFIASAVIKQVSSLQRAVTIEERAKRADFAAFQKILHRVPNVPPLRGDEL